MKKRNPTEGERRWDAASRDELIDEFTVEAGGEDERILAFLQALEKHVALPCDGFVIGEPVSVVEFEYDGNRRRGLTAKCRRVDGCEYVVGAVEVALPPSTPGSHYLAAYGVTVLPRQEWKKRAPWVRLGDSVSAQDPLRVLDALFFEEI